MTRRGTPSPTRSTLTADAVGADRQPRLDQRRHRGHRGACSSRSPSRCSDRWRQRLYPVFLVLLLGCVGIMAVGAWYGGEMVYREGIAVKLPYGESDAATQPRASPRRVPTRPPPSADGGRGLITTSTPCSSTSRSPGSRRRWGCSAIGLSLRAASTSPHWQDPELDRAGVAAMPNPQRGGAEDMAVLRSFAPQRRGDRRSRAHPRRAVLAADVPGGRRARRWRVVGARRRARNAIARRICGSW